MEQTEMTTPEESIAKFNQMILDRKIDMSTHQSEYEISNLFDYDGVLMCCCWMPIHYDEYYLDKDGCYTINIVYCHSDATLVHRSGGKIVATKLEVGQQIKFRAKTQHCLVPPEIAEQCVKHQSFRAASRFFSGIERNKPTMLPTVAVWEFVQ